MKIIKINFTTNGKKERNKKKQNHIHRNCARGVYGPGLGIPKPDQLYSGPSRLETA